MSKKTLKTKYNLKWITGVFVLSFIITVALSALSSSVNISGGHGLFAALGILAAFVCIGVLFDAVALAIATADEKPFHSMAARKIKSAKYAIKLIRNAEKIVSVFSDVIGDIAGIVSGATGAAISAALFINADYEDYKSVAGSFFVTGLIAAVTIGGKAFGKSIALNNNTAIVNAASKIIYFFSRKK
ncbi:MAG: hypothetical protein FWH24_04135 [Oscillospiraceae bacterium]|nr:hypothetical protein [Oscillospiraceae bacterium]